MRKFISAFLVMYLIVLNGPMTAFATWSSAATLHPTLAVDGGAEDQDVDTFGTAVAVDGGNVIVTDVGSVLGADPVIYFYKTDGTYVDKDTTLPNSALGVYGNAVDIDGDYAVVGLEDVGTPGSFRVYKIATDGLSWSDTVTVSCPASSLYCGSSIAIDGDTIIVGAPYADGSGSSVGAAYVYTRDSGLETWSLEASIEPTMYGWSTAGTDVGISGDYAIIGAPYAQEVHGSWNQEGMVQIYKRTGTSWAQYGSDLVGTADGDLFGDSVAIDGENVLIGSTGFENYNYDGKIYFYEGYGATLIDEFESDLLETDEFGLNVSLSGNYAVVGERYGEPDASTGADSGAAYIYKYNGTDWTTPTTDYDEVIYADVADNDSQFGWSVGIDGVSATKAVVIGQHNKPEGSVPNGYAYIYTEDGGGGGAVPEFSDYMIILVVVIALGLMVKTMPNITGKPTAAA